MKSGAAAAIAIGLGLFGTAAAGEGGPALRVFAAASMTEVVNDLGGRFADAKVTASFGSSSELARQIVDGAPADVFVAASPEWIDFLREKKALDGAALVFARNELVCVAARASGLGAKDVGDARALLENGLAEDDRVAIADAGVPAGEYARQALERLGLLDAYRPHLVGQKDVRAVLNAVEQGEMQAGFVYATDARLAGVEVLFRFDPKTHAPIEYLAAVVRASTQPALARRFVQSLRSEEARSVLARAGFALP
ncbi:MAG: molybdate ABC transporter substrate-binding protein [Myxococcota bacterium]